LPLIQRHSHQAAAAVEVDYPGVISIRPDGGDFRIAQENRLLPGIQKDSIRAA
jgi:hypothetical protein